MKIGSSYDLATTALAAIVAEYAAEGVKAPGRAYVTTGDVVSDCEQLVVSVPRVYGIDPTAGFPTEASNALMCMWWRAVQLQVQVLRCAPVGKTVRDEYVPPTPDEFSASCEAVLRDAEIVTNALVKAHRAEAFGPGYSFALEDWGAYSAEGGMIGGVLRVRIGLTI